MWLTVSCLYTVSISNGDAATLLLMSFIYSSVHHSLNKTRKQEAQLILQAHVMHLVVSQGHQT